ncbi:hypothetical protein F66182_6360 [Fusarium sp. NRRL 66182]|nr:hypothetical protein F66182_6360 [Fusarium sp. NRRL 66182]
MYSIPSLVSRPSIAAARTSTVTRKTWRLASSSEIRPNVETCITAAEELNVVSGLLLGLCAEADVQGRLYIGRRLTVIADCVGGLAVCVCQLGVVPWLFCYVLDGDFPGKMLILMALRTEAQYVYPQSQVGPPGGAAVGFGAGGAGGTGAGSEGGAGTGSEGGGGAGWEG